MAKLLDLALFSFGQRQPGQLSGLVHFGGAFSPFAVFVVLAYLRKPRATQRSLAESNRYVCDEDLWDSVQERFAKPDLKPRSRPASQTVP